MKICIHCERIAPDNADKCLGCGDSDFTNVDLYLENDEGEPDMQCPRCSKPHSPMPMKIKFETLKQQVWHCLICGHLAVQDK